MKKIFLILVFGISYTACFSQTNEKITTMDFVQALNDNLEECRFYYQNNWKVLRVNAKNKGYIHSFQLLESTPTEEAPFRFILITTYANKDQFSKREAHFQELIDANGPLKLLNSIKPGDFRKVLFGKDSFHIE